MHIRESDFDTLRFAKIKELRPEIWSGLSDTKKIEILQECSKRICNFENRPRSIVKIVDFDKLGSQNEGLLAGYNRAFNIIGISPEYLKSASSYEIFGTFIHESMHGYQYHAINNPGFHKNILDVNEWKEGNRNYISGHEFFEAYKHNSLERHSDLHGNQFAKILKHEHGMQKAQEQLDREAKKLKQNEPHQTSKKN